MEIYKFGLCSTAWRYTEPDAPGLFALVCDAGSMNIADRPETDGLTFVIFEDSVSDPLGTIEIGGRAGLNCWYLSHVGYAPDSEPDGLLPIIELIEDVAAHLLLRYFDEGIRPDTMSTAPGDRSSLRAITASERGTMCETVMPFALSEFIVRTI